MWFKGMPPSMPGMSFSKWHAIWHAKFFSHATHPKQDPSCKQLLELTKDFIDASEVAGESPFLTYFQNTRMGRSMATCIDYIFIEAEYSHLIKQMSLRHGNSDHMLLECILRSAKPHESNALWRFDER